MVTEWKTLEFILYINDTVANVTTTLNAGNQYATFAYYKLETGGTFTPLTDSVNISTGSVVSVSLNYDIAWILANPS